MRSPQWYPAKLSCCQRDSQCRTDGWKVINRRTLAGCEGVTGGSGSAWACWPWAAGDIVGFTVNVYSRRRRHESRCHRQARREKIRASGQSSHGSLNNLNFWGKLLRNVYHFLFFLNFLVKFSQETSYDPFLLIRTTFRTISLALFYSANLIF